MADGVLPWLQEIAGREAGIRSAATLNVLADRAAGGRILVRQMLAADASAAWVTWTLSRLNDVIVERVLALTLPLYRLPPTHWCWLGMGSEGRMEQTLVTDQDNGLMFAASDAVEARAMRERFLPFAGEVNNVLAHCGFPRCDGDVMAGNPRWCLSLEEWQECFFNWIRTPDPDGLLNAAIFFDFRPVAGSFSLASELRSTLTGLAGQNELFLRLMTHNALAAEPPLGLLRDFALDADGLLDLKKFGSRIFVDAARILALADGVSAVDTVSRLRGLQGSTDDNEAAVQAFLALQALRLRSHAADSGDNRIAPERLNEFDRAVLLEALRQARQLQRRLKTRFQIET